MNIRLLIGTILLVTNQPICWGGILLFGNLARKTGKKSYYVLTVTVYVLSWGMLGLGVYLVGKEYADNMLNMIPQWVVFVAAAILAAGYYLYASWKKSCR